MKGGVGVYCNGMPLEPEGNGLIVALGKILHVIRQQACLPEAISDPTTLPIGSILEARVDRKRVVVQCEDTLPTRRRGRRGGGYV